MEETKSPVGSVRRHGRNISHPMPRRNTRGPLDAGDDPLADRPTVASPSEAESSVHSIDQDNGLPPAAPSEKQTPAVDLSFLQDPSRYHQLAADDIPEAFLRTEKQPVPGMPLTELLQQGHFRRAAEISLRELVQVPPDDAPRVFSLLYTRLACLVLTSRPDVAAHEANTLTEFLARSSSAADDVIPFIPWDLRLLLVRLQAIAASDGGRRGIMALYGLAAEIRAQVSLSKDANDQTELETWSARLRDLGLRVADTLVEMGELETASRHLDTLKDVDADELTYRKALLRLRVGDVTGAQRCVDKMGNKRQQKSLENLIHFANDDFAQAADGWRSAADENATDDLSASNLAVALLYSGHISRARSIFEEIAQSSPAFPGLLFNLGTVYELCTERAVERKTDMAHLMADKEPTPDSGGWERSNFEFKL